MNSRKILELVLIKSLIAGSPYAHGAVPPHQTYKMLVVSNLSTHAHRGLALHENAVSYPIHNIKNQNPKPQQLKKKAFKATIKRYFLKIRESIKSRRAPKIYSKRRSFLEDFLVVLFAIVGVVLALISIYYLFVPLFNPSMTRVALLRALIFFVLGALSMAIAWGIFVVISVAEGIGKAVGISVEVMGKSMGGLLKSILPNK